MNTKQFKPVMVWYKTCWMYKSDLAKYKEARNVA